MMQSEYSNSGIHRALQTLESVRDTIGQLIEWNKDVRSVECYYTSQQRANFTDAQLRDYESSLKSYRDYMNTLDFKYREGQARGEAIGQARGEAIGAERNSLEIAKNLLKAGVAPEIIVSTTKLSRDVVERLR